MKGSELFRINTRIQVWEENRGEHYEATVQDVGPESFFINEPLLHAYRKLPMPVNSRWKFQLLGEDAQYQFVAPVIGYRQDQILLIEISYPNEVIRHQRRNYVRLPCNLDVEYWQIIEGGVRPGEIEPQEASRVLQNWNQSLTMGYYLDKKSLQETGLLPEGVHSFTIDISGGGVQLVVYRRPTVGTAYLVLWYLANKKIMAKAQVARVEEIKEGSSRRYRVGAKFLEMPEPIRDQIIGFIFEQMRQRR